ncbi:MAG: hypothetical protein COT43_09625 [Candidatus Marinimicrobia bacterium CG08_land_8_20_14_0_20_45_22]|nr:MAG: hypothetical protein COT43_09625 [Candidatus Marinimicrobia bacterium CG08_land_8_20_14_0_20_45_22]
MKKILVLVEGQTEETFTKTVLNPYLSGFDRYIEPKIIVTKIVKRGNQFKGGVPPYERVRNQILRLINDTSAALVSTCIDYYALPDTFPGKDAVQGRTPMEKVAFLEQQLYFDINSPRFLPYYSLHEFEALLFASPLEIANTLISPQEGPRLVSIRKQFASPEDINDRPQTCPSARIKAIFSQYQKPLHGSLIAQRTGLTNIRAECQHFSEWLRRLEEI